MLDPNPDNRPSAKDCLADPIFKHHKPLGLTVETNHGPAGNLGMNIGNFNLKQTNLEITDMPDAVDELNSPVASPLIRRASKKNDGFALNVQAMG